MIFLLIFSLVCSQPYLVSQGEWKKPGWHTADKFTLDLPGRLIVKADAMDYILITPNGDVVLSGDKREKYLNQGRYFFIVKGPATWSVYFSPCPVERGKKPMPSQQCQRWIKKQNLIGPGKNGMDKLYSIGVYTLEDAEEKGKINYQGRFPWMDWLKDEKLSQVPPFKPGQSPREAHFIYRAVLIMLSYHKKSGVFCLPIKTEEPSLLGIYRYLGWDAVNLKDFNAIGVRLYRYLLLRKAGLSSRDAFVRADSQARVIFATPFRSDPLLEEVFQEIYRRFFQ